MTQMNVPMKQKQRCWHRKQTSHRQGGGVRRGMECEVGVSRYKAFYKQWISKVLLYSTEIYIQYPIINHSGKKLSLKMCVCNNHFAVRY